MTFICVDLFMCLSLQRLRPNALTDFYEFSPEYFLSLSQAMYLYEFSYIYILFLTPRK